MKTKPVDPREALFKTTLATARTRTAQATGNTPEEFKYQKAGSVRRSKIAGYMDVVFRKVTYYAVRSTWGPLDQDPTKSTVLIRAEGDRKWYKLWFFDTDVTD